MNYIWTVSIINMIDSDAAIWTSSFDSQHKANSFHDAAKNWIERHGLSNTLKIEEDCTRLNSEDYLDWLEEEYEKQ